MPASLLGRSRPRGLGLPARTGSLGQDRPGFSGKNPQGSYLYIIPRAEAPATNNRGLSSYRCFGGCHPSGKGNTKSTWPAIRGCLPAF
jgi:hypothetical protein